jgi:signal transduction histidine kinase
MDVAHRRLPGVVREVLHRPLGDDVVLPPVEPVTVRTRDEVRDVAEALTSVQRTAVDLAVEQAFLHRTLADSFVNLGRRNQNLLSRQLDFIARLESSEAEATNLASLFELDHLATRMRRNAESLLVLAGLQPPRTGAAPVGITDVVRAALAEIEGYERVDVRNVAPTAVVGTAAADLTHMLAELIENALTFSPPGRSVEVRGLARPDGYVLSIVDAGPGMSPAETEQANRRLTGEESYTVAPSTNLGHYVAGQLAARHGVAVRVDTLAGGGLVATITVPQALVAVSSGFGHRPGPGHRPGAGRPSPEWPGPGAAPARPPAGVVPAVLAEDHPGELTSGP